MTNAKSLALVVVSLGGTVTGRTNAGLLADIVRALGGTPTGNTNADLIGEIAAALGGEAGEGTNADRLKAVADALDVDASGTNAEVLAAILTGLGGSPEAGDTNAALILGISEHPPGPGPTPTPKYTVRFHVATDSVGYGTVSPASVADVEEGAALSASGQAVLVGGVSGCTATPEEDTQEYDYAFVKWTGADDASTAVPATVTEDLDLYAHFSRTPVTPDAYDVTFYVASDSTGYGSVSPVTIHDVPAGTSVTVAQTLVVGAVGQCVATPETATAQYAYAYASWTGADDSSTPAATAINSDTAFYAHFTRSVREYTVSFDVATDSAGYGSVSPASVGSVPYGTAITAGQTLSVGAVGQCVATPAADTSEYTYGYQGWTGADDASTAVPATVTGDVTLYAHFSRTPVTPEPMGPSLFTFTVADGEATVTGWAGTPPADGYDLYFPDTDGNGHPLTAIGGSSDSSHVSVWAGAATVRGDAIETVGERAFRNAAATSVSLPSATTIGSNAFRDCTSLASVSLPAATSLGVNCFSGCTSLASVSLPAATTIGSNAFYNCTSLASVSLPAATTIDDFAFHGCTGIEAVTLGPLTGTLTSSAFPWNFYDTDGTTVLYKTAADLANSTFVGTASKLVKQ